MREYARNRTSTGTSLKRGQMHLNTKTVNISRSSVQELSRKSGRSSLVLNHPLHLIRTCKQNRRQKVFNKGLCSSAGELCVCTGGLGIIKLTKIPLIYSVPRFNLGGLGALLGGLNPPKPPRGDGTACKSNEVTLHHMKPYLVHLCYLKLYGEQFYYQQKLTWQSFWHIATKNCMLQLKQNKSIEIFYDCLAFPQKYQLRTNLLNLKLASQ